MNTQNVDLRNLVDNYDFPCTLPSGIELKIRPITTAKMKRILAYENEKDSLVIEEALDDLIKSCVVNEDFNLDDLYLQDRFFLLIELRKISKGVNYTFNFNCPVCKVENIKTVVLSELEVTPYGVENNIVEFTDKIKFDVSFPTRGNQLTAAKTVPKTLGESERLADIGMLMYAQCINRVLVDDNEVEASLEDKLYLLNNVPTSSFDTFKKWFSDNDFGVNFEFEARCMSGDFTRKTEIPLEGFFV